MKTHPNAYQDAVILFHHIVDIGATTDPNDPYANNNNDFLHNNMFPEHINHMHISELGGIMHIDLLANRDALYAPMLFNDALKTILGSDNFTSEDTQKFLTLVCHHNSRFIEDGFINEWLEILLNKEALFVTTPDFNALETLKSLLSYRTSCSDKIITKAKTDGEITVEDILSLVLNGDSWAMRDTVPLIFSWESNLSCTEDQLITAAKSLNGHNQEDEKWVMQLIEHTDIQCPANVLHKLCTSRYYAFGKKVANSVWQKWFNSIDQEEQKIITEFNGHLSSVAHLLHYNLQEIEELKEKGWNIPIVVKRSGNNNYNFNGILMNLFMDWPYNTIDFLSVKKQAQDIVFHYLKEISNIEGSLEAHPGLNFIYNFFLENINLDTTP